MYITDNVRLKAYDNTLFILNSYQENQIIKFPYTISKYKTISVSAAVFVSDNINKTIAVQ